MNIGPDFFSGGHQQLPASSPEHQCHTPPAPGRSWSWAGDARHHGNSPGTSHLHQHCRPETMTTINTSFTMKE